MAYTKTTNFATKDALSSGDPLKIVKGTELNTEFDNIATASALNALKGANSDITSLSGLTTPLSIAQGGTSGATASAARSALTAAASGANADITSMTALTAPTVAANPIRATDLQVQLATAFTTGGTGTAFTLTPVPAVTAYATNQEWDVSFSAACGAAPTFQVSGVATPPNLVRQNADGTYSNLVANDFPSGWQSNVKMVSATQALVRSLPVKSVAFSVGKGGTNQTGIASATYTKVTWPTEIFDTNNNFATDKFTPTVAGKYILTAAIVFTASVDATQFRIAIYKNGANFRNTVGSSSGTGVQGISVAIVDNANGTTDYYEVYVYQETGAAKDIDGAAVNSYFTGAML